MKKFAIGVIALTVSGALASTPGAAGRGSAGPLIPPPTRVLGRSYAGWTVASWQWALAHGHSPVGPNVHSLSCLSSGQRGPVWFLRDEYEGDGPLLVSCKVPVGRYLFLEGPTFECSNVEPPPYQATVAGLVACANKFVLGGAQVSLDARPLTSSAYPVTTPVFGFVMSPTANLLRAPGQTHGDAAVHGDAVMLRPLRRGPHTILQVEHFTGGKVVQVTWRLNVR